MPSHSKPKCRISIETTCLWSDIIVKTARLLHVLLDLSVDLATYGQKWDAVPSAFKHDRACMMIPELNHGLEEVGQVEVIDLVADFLWYIVYSECL